MEAHPPTAVSPRQRPPADIAERVRSICADLEIEIIDTRTHRGAGQTHAAGTMERILAEFGEGHLILVLRSIFETRDGVNATALIAPVIWAMSDAIRTRPEWAGLGLRWLEVLDELDMPALVRQAKQSRLATVRAYFATILLSHLHAALTPPPVPLPVKAPKPDMRAARAALVMRKLAIGREVLDLRRAHSGNVTFGRLARTRFPDLGNDPNAISEYRRVAERYGTKPEVAGLFAWATLVALSSPAVPVRVRDGIERRAVAGEWIRTGEVLRLASAAAA